MTDPSEPPVEHTEVIPGEGSQPRRSATDLRTFLIADIRGYTKYTQEHGDEAAAALASRFAELVEEVVTEREGFVVELRGDEALVVFVSARRALRAAMDLQARFKEAQLPRGVGIGLDAGEAIPVGSGYRGTALNLAARLCAEAGPGETLASEAVIHLAARMDGIAYVDARALRLKGYGEAVRVVDVVPADQTKGRRMGGGGGWRSRGRDAWLVLAAAAIAALVIAAVGANALGLGPFSPAGSQPARTTAAESTAHTRGPSTSPTDLTSDAPTGTPNPLAVDAIPLLAFYDGTTGELQSTTPFESPRNIAFYSAGSFWMLSENPSTLNRLDSETHAVVQRINVPFVAPSGFNFDDKYIWVTDLEGPNIARLDKATGTHEEFSFAADEDDTVSATDIAVGDGSVWLARPDPTGGGGDEITRIDAEKVEVTARIPVTAFGVSFGEDSLWYWAEGRLGRIDPETEELAFDEELELGTVGWLNNIYFGGGFAWTAEGDSGTLWRVDRLGGRTGFGLAPGIAEMASTPGTIWVTNANTGQLTGVDFVTGQHNQVIDTGHATLAVAAGGDELMVAVGPTDDEVIAALDGNVLRISTPYQPWFDPSPDPALNGTWEVRQALYVTCLQLVNYPDKAAPDGWALQPEAAESMPTVSEDGRTYTFTIKSGFAFSPPSNEPITADTFKATIERALLPVFNDDAPGPQTYSDIVGVAEFRAGTAEDISGIVASGNVLTITLEEPSPTFLDRLALSWVCPVPIDTPALRSGLNPSPPVSGAGPYYVASRLTRRLVILKKNPNYHGPRLQPFDAISIRMRMSPETAIDHVERGISDAAILPPFEPLADAYSDMAEEWGPGSANAEAGDQRWFGAPKPGMGFLAFNQTRGPFSDPVVRQAVALTVDRAELNSIFIQSPTDDLYLPGAPGAPPSSEPVPQPDLAGALALMDGRTFDVVMQGWPEEWGCGECRAFEQAITSQLQEIGINVTIRRDEHEHPADAFERDSPVDLISFGTGTDLPDTASLLEGLNFIAWLGEDNLAELTRLEGLSGEPRSAAAIAFAQQVVDEETLIVPIGYDALRMYLSERIGCGIVQPAIGAVDLLSLCVEDGS